MSRSQGEGEDYVIPACISSTAIDSHHSRMDLDTTLNNFVAEATAGVVTMDSHNNQCGLGNTRNGELKEEQVWAELTVVPDTPLSALASYPNTDIFHQDDPPSQDSGCQYRRIWWDVGMQYLRTRYVAERTMLSLAGYCLSD